MRVLRGRAGDIESDRARTRAMGERVGETEERALRVWTPHRQVAFGRRDAREDGYERACEAAEEAGFPTVERRVGGRVVAYTGSTIAFAHAEPVADIRSGLDERYAAATADLEAALDRLGVSAQTGEPPDSFCPGTHSLQAENTSGAESGANGMGKIVGIAQRIGGGVALVAGIVVIDAHEAIAAVLDPVYNALAIPFDPDSVGSIERAGGETDERRVLEAIEGELVGDAEDISVERIDGARR